MYVDNENVNGAVDYYTEKLCRVNCDEDHGCVGGVLCLWSYTRESKNTRRLILKESSSTPSLRYSLHSVRVEA